MISLKLVLNSIVLLRPVTVDVMLPYSIVSGTECSRVLLALHPAMEDGGFYLNKLGLINQIDELSLAIVAPSLGNYYFIDSLLEKQSTFLEKELIPIVSDIIKLPRTRESRLLLGVSMGAFGACRLMCCNPLLFSKVALISGVYDVSIPIDQRALKSREQRSLMKLFYERILCSLLKTEDRELREQFDLKEMFPFEGDAFPQVGLWCGDQDFLSLNQTKAFATLCEDRKFVTHVSIDPGGHNLAYWKDIFSSVIQWLIAEVS